MLQVEPKETYPITRYLEDPTDTATRYVRALVYKPRTNELLATLNLTDRGSQRFDYNYEIPADVSGQGYFLQIIVKVYDDSAYTTESNRYERKEINLLVQQRWNQAFGSGGGGIDINYKKIQEIIRDEVKNEFAKLPKPEKPKEVNLRDLEDRLAIAKDRIISEIKSIKIPEQEKVDFGLVIKTIKDIKIPEHDEFDYSMITDTIGDLKSILQNEFYEKAETIKNLFNDLFEELKKPLIFTLPEGAKMNREENKEKEKETEEHLKINFRDYFKNRL